MKIKVISDLHLEILSETTIEHLGMRVAKTPADVLVMAGDICPLKSKRWKTFLDQCDHAFGFIIWVPGNHEYYGSNVKMAIQIHRRRVSEWNEERSYRTTNHGRLEFLDNEAMIWNNQVQFIGSTLWTDFDKQDPLVMLTAQQCMNDFNRIKYDGRRMTPYDQYVLHQRAKCWIFDMVRSGNRKGLKNFVITHHGPSEMSIHPKYRNADRVSQLLNHCYVSEMTEALNSYDIECWVHGHTHNSFDYRTDTGADGTRVVVNPHGYHNENAFGFDPDKLIEIETKENFYGRLPNCS